jgi:Methyltransferase FkbM domain
MMSMHFLKSLMPNREMNLPVLFGPFRGGVFRGRPRGSLRKIFGLYEHELNAWLSAALLTVDDVMDVGANDGYFTFGCAAALLRNGKSGRIVAWEPDPRFQEGLGQRAAHCGNAGFEIILMPIFAGSRADATTGRLDQFAPPGSTGLKRRCLIKIDVEGAEMDVLSGAGHWLEPQNVFLVEVHDQSFIVPLTEMFNDHDIRTRLINQQPLYVLGRENRSRDNWWLVSELDGHK